ncbi:hypothetical protein EK21DRAFT_12561, partial [Setomelanomma holmii]
ISVQSLPLTFQHAITVTRGLGLRYLWIDSLCIYQDNISDWATEASCIGQIYGNAACGIAATAAEDGTAGLFYDRDPIMMTPVRVEITHSRHGNVYFQNTVSQGSYFLSPSTAVYGTIDFAPLNKRAWIAQECYLSPRIAHFTNQTLHWECHETFANKLYPNGLPINLIQRKRDLYTAWCSFRRFYTGCQLTRQEDKLIALSGIAEVI